MKLLFTFLIFGSQMSYASGKFLFDFRSDYQSQNFDQKAKDQGFYSNQKIFLRTARLDYSNRLNDQIFFRGRLTLNTDQGAVNKRDSLNNFVELFFVENKFNDFFKFSIGKMVSDMGGFEQITPSPDVYFQSLVNSGIPSELETWVNSIYQARTSTAAGFSSSEMSIIKYFTAAKFTTQSHFSDVSIIVANLPSDDLGGSKLNQSRMLNGFVISTHAFEKNLLFNFSLHDSFLPKGKSIDSKVTYLAAGLKFTTGQNQFDLDFLKNSFKQRTLITGDDELESIVTTWSYDFDQWTTKLKYELSKLKVIGESIFDLQAVGIALEYKPNSIENFRYHLAYNFKNYKPVIGDSLNSNEVIAGIRLNADLIGK